MARKDDLERHARELNEEFRRRFEQRLVENMLSDVKNPRKDELP